VDTKQKEKLERYFKNSSHFLWGLGEKNQKVTYPWLRNKGKRLWGANFDFRDSPYRGVTEQLLVNPGIERLLRDLIVPRVKEQFSDKAIEFLRLSWNVGNLPSITYLKQYNVEDAYPFIEINRQFNYVERWGELAGVWFEEIEPWLKE
jgi:hypothetical protein